MVNPVKFIRDRKFQQRMADSISNGSENEEVTDQFSVWITRSQGTQTVAIALSSSPCRWTTKAFPALLNFTKSTARSSKPSRKCTRVFAVYVDKATWLFQKCFRQCTRMIYLICFQCFLMWYISLEWYLLHCIVFCGMIIQYVAQIENLLSQHHGATPCQYFCTY